MTRKRSFVEIVLALWLASVALAVAAGDHVADIGRGAAPDIDGQTLFYTFAAGDALVSSGEPFTNFGSRYYLRAGTDDCGNFYRSYAHFVLDGVRHQGQLHVQQAEIKLEGFEFFGSPGLVYCSPVAEPWEELEVCWKNRPAVERPAAAVFVEELGSYRWDITDIVKGWLDGQRPNYGVCFYADDMFSQDMTFLSRDNNGPPALYPVLSVTLGPDLRTPSRGGAQLEETGTILVHNDPNPFRERTDIHYSVARQSDINLSVHSVDGRMVRGLETGSRVPGEYCVTWDGRDDYGRETSRGIYYVRLSTKDHVHEHKLVKTE